MVAAALVLLLTVAAPVSAQEPPEPREYGESGVDSGVVRIRAGADWLPAGSEGSSGAGTGCTDYEVTVATDDDFVQSMGGGPTVSSVDGLGGPLLNSQDDRGSVEASVRRFSPTGRWYLVVCDGAAATVPEGGPAVTVAALAIEAANLIDPPEPELAIVPAELHYTQLESWLAVEPAYMVDRSETASAGRVFVTATADPYQADFEMGNGDLVECLDGGVVWQPGAEPGPDACIYTYTDSSAGQPGDAFDVVGTVLFEVTAVSNAPVGPVTLPDIDRSSLVSVQVGEIQAVND